MKYRSQTRNGDQWKIDIIQDGLAKLKENPLPSVREKELMDEGFLRGGHLPDLIINKRIILEHDTIKSHGELGSEDSKTLRRNTDYVVTKRPFFVINQDLAKHCGLDEVRLAEYLYYHTIMLDRANKEASLRGQV